MAVPLESLGQPGNEDTNIGQILVSPSTATPSTSDVLGTYSSGGIPCCILLRKGKRLKTYAKVESCRHDKQLGVVFKIGRRKMT